MDFKGEVVWAAAVVGLVGAWLVAGPSPAVEAQEASTFFEWELVAGRVTGWGGGQGISGSWEHGRLFRCNRATGKAYKFFPSCGDDNPNGCFASIPMLELTIPSESIPTPTGHGGESLVR